MADARKLTKFLKDYSEYVRAILVPTKRELKAILDDWKISPRHWGNFAQTERLAVPSPIQRIRIRVKRPESVIDKIARSRDRYPAGLSPESFRSMDDAVAGRVIVYFLRDLPMIDHQIRNSGQFELHPTEASVAYLTIGTLDDLGLAGNFRRTDKQSGYASLHYLLRLTDSSVPLEDRPWLELQVRTFSQDLWAEVEHILGYKPGKRTSLPVRKTFQVLSRQLGALDDLLNMIAEELIRFQEESTFEDTDPLNPENFPATLSEVAIRASQQEIDGMIKLLVSRGVETVGQLRALLHSGRLDVIRNAYRTEEGRTPTTFEIVAQLANIADIDRGRQLAQIKAQIALLKTWDELKQNE